MKTIRKMLACLLAFGSVLPVVSCKGGDENKNSSTDVQLYFWDSGYGSEFMENIVDKYNESQSDYHVTLDVEADAATIILSLDIGKANTYDLYFTMLNTMQYNKDFTSLNDVLDSNAKGESVTIKSKYDKNILKGIVNADGSYNTLTYGSGWVGIVYNKAMISQDRLPNTTKELEYLTSELAGEKENSAWIFYNDQYNNGYWNYLINAWEAQYDGLDYYYNTTMKLTDANGNAPSKDVMLAKDGRYQALKVLESILTPTTVHPEATSRVFTKVQTLFMNGHAAMMPNGNWLTTESSGSAEIGMMKMPVISTIVEKLENNKMTDSTLSAIIDEIDAGATSSDKCSDNDFKRIKEARNIMFNNSCEQYVFIPDYSPAKEGAKDFLRYFYSDEGTVEFMKSTGLPTFVDLTDESKFDKSTLDAWGKEQFAMMDTAIALTDIKTKADLYFNMSLNQYANLTYAQSFFSSNAAARKTADDLWTDVITRVNENWEDWT